MTTPTAPTIEEIRVGRMTWTDALAGPLTGTTCLWTDLDGVHVAPPPAAAPPTSILWAWTRTHLVRIRLDGQDTYVAARQAPPSTDLVTALPWPVDDGRVRQLRAAPDTNLADLRQMRWNQLLDNGDHQSGAITFLQPVPVTDPPGTASR